MPPRHAMFPTVMAAPAAVRRGLARMRRAVGRAARRWGWWFLAVLALLCAVHLAATLITGRMLARQLTALRVERQPLTMRELAPRLPEGARNAADVYEQAFARLHVSEQDATRLFVERNLPARERAALVRAVVSQNAEYFRLLEEASRIPECVFPVQWDSWWVALLPHVPRLQHAATMLSLQAEALADEGRYDDAAAAVTTILRIVSHFAQEPWLASKLNGYRAERTGVEALARVLSKGSPSAAALRSLSEQLSGLSRWNHLADLAPPECLDGIRFFDRVRTRRVGALPEEIRLYLGEHQGFPGPFRRVHEATAVWLGRTLGRPLLNLDEVRYLRAVDECARAADLPWPGSEQGIGAIASRAGDHGPYSGRLARNMCLAWERAAWQRDWTAALVGAARLAVELEIYRTRAGGYPDSVADLPWAGRRPPTDPFGGGAYRYRREGHGFVVWSIGPDLADNQGRAADWEVIARRYYTHFDPSGRERRQAAERGFDIAVRVRRGAPVRQGRSVPENWQEGLTADQNMSKY